MRLNLKKRVTEIVQWHKAANFGDAASSSAVDRSTDIYLFSATK